MSKKLKPTFELIEETPVEQPTFVPTYPGEQGIDLDSATVARLEAEKQAVLAGLHVAPSKPWTKPAEAVVVEEEIAAAATIVPVEAAELQAARDAVTKLQRGHAESVKTAELAFQAQMTEAMKQLGAVELRAAQAIDAATSSKLRDALASMNESTVGDDVRASRADAGAGRQDALRRRAAHALQTAAETRRLLKQFDKEFGTQLDALGQVSQEEFLVGTPNDGVAHMIYREIRNGLDSIKALRESLGRARSSRASRRRSIGSSSECSPDGRPRTRGTSCGAFRGSRRPIPTPSRRCSCWSEASLGA